MSLLGIKRTCPLHCEMSGYDPKRTFAFPYCGQEGNFRLRLARTTQFLKHGNLWHKDCRESSRRRLLISTRRVGMERRLAAILAADVAGYSREMEAAEEQTAEEPAQLQC